MAKARSGGGIRGNKVAEKRESTRFKPRVRAANKAAVSEIGYSRGAHTTEKGDIPFKREGLYSGAGYPTEFGNSKALEGAGAGARPGGGNRNLYGSGSQQQYGPATGTPPGPSKDTLSEFGPERKVGG